VNTATLHRLAAIGVVADFLFVNLAMVAGFALMPNVTFAGRLEATMLDVVHVCEIQNTIVDDLIGIGALAISLIINMVGN
jgi:hypothetical protein